MKTKCNKSREKPLSQSLQENPNSTDDGLNFRNSWGSTGIKRDPRTQKYYCTICTSSEFPSRYSGKIILNESYGK